MKKSLVTLSLAAFAAAIVLTSCSGSKSGSAGPRGELLKIANNEYANHYTGIGQYTSNSERVAANASSVDARNNLATEVKNQIISLAKLSAASENAKAAEAYMDDILQKVNTSLTDVRIQDVRTVKEKDNYTIYTLVSVPKDAALRTVNNIASTEEAVGNALGAKAIMSVVNSELDKYR